MNKVFAVAAAAASLCVPVLADQASITLLNSDVAYCYKQDQPWTINKTNSTGGSSVLSGSTVNWTITATPLAAGPKQLCAVGIVTVANTGSANATIGNIIVNLQRSQTGANKWKAVAADVADAQQGDASTIDRAASAALASQTDYSQVAVIVGQVATFGENAVSGSLDFTDASNNTTFSITPEPQIAPGASITLFFRAVFNPDKLSTPLNPGELLRTEVLVSFGNSGSRGGSGSSAQNIDINGNGVIDADEANVRTVPTRITNPLPALQICNQTVTITDTFSATNTASVSNISGQDPGPGTQISALTGTTVFQLSGTVSGDGVVTNMANLYGADSAPITLLSGTYTFPGLCCTAVDLFDSSSVNVFTVSDRPATTAYCSYSRNEFLHNGAGNPLLVSNFSSVFVTATYGPNTRSGLLVGDASSLHAGWNNETTFEGWLNGGGAEGALTATTFNASSTSGGKLPKDVAALVLNVKMSGIANSIGNLVYHLPGDFFDGKTVSQILATAQSVVAGGALPAGYSYNGLDGLIDHLNQSWNKCKPNALVNQGKLY
jgi:hypothetical protein